MLKKRRFFGLFPVALLVTVAVAALFHVKNAMSTTPRPPDAAVHVTVELPTWATKEKNTLDMQVKVEGAIHRFFCKDQPLFTYLLNDGKEYKTYLSELYTPNGRNILRDSPADHIHHHSLMYAISVDGIDFWTEATPEKRAIREQYGVQVATESKTCIEEYCGESEIADSIATYIPITWFGPERRNKEVKLLEEQRTIEMLPKMDKDVRLLTWRSELSVPEGKDQVVLSGSHYFGLGLRFDQSMDKNGTFLSDLGAGKFGVNVRGDEHVTPCKWMLYTADLNGEPVTVAVFDDPANPRPMHAFTMGQEGNSFAYLSATINLYKESLVLTKEKPLTFQYGVAVWDGTKTAEEVQKEYEAWVYRVTPHP